jgi:hypothetical protein
MEMEGLFRPCAGGLESIHHKLASHRKEKNEEGRCLGYNWPTPSQEHTGIATGTWFSRLRFGRKGDELALLTNTNKWKQDGLFPKNVQN